MKTNRSFRVTFEPFGKSVEVDRGTTILEAAIKGGMGIRSECGGFGICGKCKVQVKDTSSVSKITSIERKFISSEELRKGLRLACQTQILGNCTVYVPQESRVAGRKMLVVGLEQKVPLKPVVKKIHLLIPKPSLKDIRADCERTVETLLKVLKARGTGHEQDYMVNHELLKNFPNILREAGWDVTLVLREGEILDVEKGNTEGKNYGLAIDIGTSKIVIYLTNVEDGNVVGINSLENPQLLFGEDIMTRLTFAMRSSENFLLLRKVLIDGINAAIEEIVSKSNVDLKEIYEAVVVGNTAMHHIFLGIETKYLALSPYVPAVRDLMSFRAKEVGLKISKSGYIVTLPVIGGFVGADGVADILATGLHKSDEISMLLDIGTNTEVFLGNKDGILACSAASGPAFEGGHIKFGMKAVAGAIERVSIEPETFKVTYKTVEGEKPVGICGSAVIDVVAGLLRSGLVDVHGRIREVKGTSRVRRVGNEVEFVVAWKQETGIGEDITVTQRDIREIQLAKAAIYTAQAVLMRKKGIRPEDIKNIFIAGAFGSEISVRNAIFIGLLPEVKEERVKFVGNTAITGAKMALISKDVRRESKDILGLVNYVELSLDPSFQEEFINATELPHRDLSKYPTVKKYLKKWLSNEENKLIRG